MAFFAILLLPFLTAAAALLGIHVLALHITEVLNRLHFRGRGVEELERFRAQGEDYLRRRERKLGEKRVMDIAEEWRNLNERKTSLEEFEERLQRKEWEDFGEWVRYKREVEQDLEPIRRANANIMAGREERCERMWFRIAEMAGWR